MNVPRIVHFVLLPQVHLLDLAGAAQAFDEAAHLGGRYRVRFCAASSEVASAQGPGLSQLQPLRPVEREDRVIVAGMRSDGLDRLAPQVPSEWLRRAAGAGARVASVCTGAFALGHAGLLDGRRCTTHWKVTDRLQREFPGARVERDRLFVEDRGVTTSAGVTSGIDMALSMIEADHGPLVAARVAREMVVYARRDGADRQQSVYLDYRTHLHPAVHQVQDWLVAHPEANPTLPELARVAAMSPRNLTRTFRAVTGLTLKEFSTRLKLEVARTLLQDPRLTFENVAARCGYGDGRQLRRIWQREHGESPTEWRRRQRRRRAS